MSLDVVICPSCWFIPLASQVYVLKRYKKNAMKTRASKQLKGGRGPHDGYMYIANVFGTPSPRTSGDNEWMRERLT